MFDIVRYTADRQAEWDGFVAQSKNGTFLLQRPYMDYHADRFADHSLLFFRQEKLYALLPANRSGDTLHSHQGLTYGGLVMSERCTGADVLRLFGEMNEWLRRHGIRTLVYKPIPHIYSSLPADEDLYALFRSGARLVARGLSSCIPFPAQMKWHKDRHTALNRSVRAGITVRKTRAIRPFWAVLTANLHTCHGVRPVHTAAEMELLMQRFPHHITLYEAVTPDGTCVAGMLTYRTRRVLHSQYLSASPEGKKCGAIEAIMQQVMQEEGPAWFDFGISTEQGGQVLNEGLIYQKEGFGGRGICYDTYEYTLS